MDYPSDSEAPTLKSRFSAGLDRTEAIYLRILRGAILVLATFLIIAALVLGTVSIYKMTRDEGSVVEKSSTVSGEDVAATSLVEGSRPAGAARREPAIDTSKKRFYDDFIKRYHRLFVAKYEPARQADDKKISQAEFGDAFIAPAERLELIDKNELNFEQDRADLETMLPVLATAADLPRTRSALERYRSAKKVQVCRSVERTRYESRQGWDSNATHCADWYVSPTGCSVTRAVEIPYTQRQCTMQFPEGTRSHADLMRGHQDEFFRLLSERRDANSAAAESERAAIRAGNAEGQLSLMTSLQILGGFLVLMFFFLLIAIERHQRKNGQRPMTG